LPAGFTFVNAKLDKNSGRCDSSQSILYAQQNDGRIRLLVYSLISKPFQGTKGSIIQLQLKVGKEVAAGSYPISLSGIELAAPQQNIHHSEPVIGHVNVIVPTAVNAAVGEDNKSSRKTVRNKHVIIQTEDDDVNTAGVREKTK